MRALALPKESPTHEGDRCVLPPLLLYLIYLLFVVFSFVELLPAPLKLAGRWLALGKHLSGVLRGLVLSKESGDCIEEFQSE